MIIDSHAHWGPWFFSLDSASLEVNQRQLDRFGIDKQVVSAVEAIVYDPVSGNAALAAELDRAQDDRIHGYITVDPRELDAAERDLRQYVAPRWVGVKIHSHYSRTPLAAPAMTDAVRLATSAGLPVLLHTWGDDVLDLIGLAERVPAARHWSRTVLASSRVMVSWLSW